MRIFITGVSSGIGKALAIRLVREGHEVFGIARRREHLDKLTEEINSELFRYERCDISDPQQLAELFQTMVMEAYLPDVIVLNAALDLEDNFPAISFSNGAQMMRTNVEGAYYWICKFIEPFLERGTGQFIGVSSIFAHWPDSACVAYSASKSALSMLFRGLRVRYAKSNLSFKLIYLGPVDTPINPRFKDRQVTKKSFLVSTPEAVARYISKSIHSQRQNFYFPLYIRSVFCLLKWLPDNMFQFLTQGVRR